ncbi:class I SAM-dependent methyltransferase [Streptomyces sp. NPDC058045]|uniref:class I SAM-dependent methyltransferase n=1 Tax=Streptomyces sp. NPDC058045 TaxID=3346311 RepID=UPI0036E3E0BA
MPPESDDFTDDAERWDTRYRESERVWSGEPNAELVHEISGLPPGHALDLGCGEGGDAIWLARRGWHVTAVDVSRVALERAARHAEQADPQAAARIDFQRYDLGTGFPDGRYDLVSAQFLYPLGEVPREEILRTAAAAVAPGGTLLVVSHSGPAPWEENPHPGMEFPTPRELLASLRLPADRWQILRCEDHPRTQPAPDGTPTHRWDNTIRARLLPEQSPN